MKTVKQTLECGKIQVLPGEMIFIGLDVHKLTYHVALWSRERGLLTSWVQPSDGKVLHDRVREIPSYQLRIVYEAGPTGFGLARQLKDLGYRIEVIAPSHIPQLPGRQAKTDRLDCKKLAMLSAKGMLRKIYIPSEQEEADRQVVRYREQTVRKRRRCMVQIKSYLLQHGIAEPAGLKDWSAYAVIALRQLELGAEIGLCLNSLLDELDWFNQQARKATGHIRALARTSRHQQAFQHLGSIPGVGLITAMTFRTEFPTPERFDKAEQVSRIIGLAPSISKSGQTERRGPIMKSGNSRVRAVLVEAAWRWIRADASAKKTFGRILGNTGDSKKAIVAMARRLAICMWRISVRQTDYQMQAA